MSASPGVAAGVLAALPLFRQTPRSQVALLAREARTSYAARGAVIARRGERLPGLAAVAYGLVKLSLKGETEKVLRLVGPGECFPEAWHGERFQRLRRANLAEDVRGTACEKCIAYE